MTAERNKKYMEYMYTMTSQQPQKERNDVYIVSLSQSVSNENTNFLYQRYNVRKSNRKVVRLY